MKLNSRMPNILELKEEGEEQEGAKQTRARFAARPVCLLIITIVSLTSCVQNSHCQQQQQQTLKSSPDSTVPLVSNEISSENSIQDEPHLLPSLPSKATNFSHSSRDVTSLHLVPDFRSIKLSWAYKYRESNEPASFQIRFCELTSWRSEIKCRSRDLPVVHLDGRVASLEESSHESKQTTVIVEGPKFSFETQIFDLRALTNYTFQVRVLRFLGEHQPPPVEVSAPLTPISTQSNQRPGGGRRSSASARHLNLSSGANHNELGHESVEQTKGFGAEATRCLANSSEVLVQTGRYFGGRISVEGQLDGRCSLLGNKSSDQTSYLFRIDHELCKSRVTDGNRIESMILVHENRDILTHNTARFLVLCDFSHRSFTVRASVSLPKVNAKTPSRSSSSSPYSTPTISQPAIITRLKQPASASGDANEPQQQVRIGSMPGIYRPLISTTISTTSLAGQAEPTESSNQSTPANAWTSATTTASNQAHNQQSWPSMSGQQPPEVATNSIQRASERNGTRQAKKLARAEPGDELKRGHLRQQATSELPGSVDVSGSLMFVDDNLGATPPAGTITAATTMTTTTTTTTTSGGQRNAKSLLVVGNSTLADGKKVLIFTSAHQANQLDQRKRSQSSGADSIESRDIGATVPDQPVVMTNNHRVSADLLALNGQQAPKVPADGLGSMKYSPASVAEYSVGKLEQVLGAKGEPAVRSRTGRMRSMGSHTTGEPAQQVQSRMGDVPAIVGPPPATSAADLVMAESEQSSVRLAGPLEATSPPNNPAGGQDDGGQHLAHNLTSALIRWSLRTLGNLAKKSLEGLSEADNSSALAPVNELPPPTSGPSTTGTRKSVGRQLARPASSAESRGTKRPAIEQADGFLVDKTPARGRAMGDPTAPTTRPQKASAPAPVRANNKHQPATTASPPATSDLQPTSTGELAGENNDTVRLAADERHRSSVWLIYGLWALICLVCLTGAAIYLMIARPRALTGCLAGGPNGPPHFTSANGHRLMFAATSNQSNEFHCALDKSHLSQSPPSTLSSTLRRSLICHPKLLAINRPTCNQQESSSSSGSERTRSSSAASTCNYSVGEENQRKLNEFVFTDHVLINNTFAGGGSGGSGGSGPQANGNESFA